MTTTLNQIRSHRPCQEGWAKLLKHLNKNSADDEPLSLLTVLTSNGLDDAIWCLRTEPEPTPERTQRFALAVARRVQHLHPQTEATLDIVDRFLSGQATKAELDAAYAAAYTARYAAYAANAAAHAAHAAHAARYAAHAARCAAAAAVDAATEAAAGNAAYAAYAAHAACLSYATNAAAAATDIEAEREAQAQIFREIFA